MNEINDKTKTCNFSFIILVRRFLLMVIPIMLLYITILPVIFSFFSMISYINLLEPIFILVMPLIMIFEVFLFILIEVLVFGLFIKIFRIKYNEGEYKLTLKDKNVYKFTLFYTLNHFPIKSIEFFNLLFLKEKFLSLVGLKIGKNSGLGTTGVSIMDPCLTEIGDNSHIGAYSVIAAHTIENDRLIIRKVKIGNNCIIGGVSLLLPGVNIEDNVTLGARSLALKNATLKNGKKYAGNPVKELNL